jgi:UDP-N-acetylmuramoyl-tripeptide--D-alanyl-D-alanine ligase
MARYSSDTRSLQPGDTFVAVRGERTDGHAYLAEAVARGAAGLIVDAGAFGTGAAALSGLPERVEVVRVPDTVVHLGELARQRLAELRPMVVAVTGSMGKTTTKNAIATVAAQAFPVLAPKGNLNTLLGLSVTVLNELHDTGQVLVAEMGAYQPGDLAQICEYIRPAIAVVTNVRPVHLERMGSIENVALAKGEIVDALPEDGIFCLNADDPRVAAMAARCRGHVLSYGAGAAGTGAEITPALIQMPIPLLGAYQVYTALAGYSVGRCLGLSDAAINAGLAQLRPEKGRLKSLPGRNGSRLIDDTYNASRDSMLAALEVLAGQPAARRFAVLGDMLELGSVEREAHREVVARALQVAGQLAGQMAGQMAGGVVLVGPRLAAAAAELGAQPQAAFANSKEAGAAQAAGQLLQPQPGDLILIKGSEGMRMERLTEQLIAPEVDRERELPRQDVSWKQI